MEQKVKQRVNKEALKIAKKKKANILKHGKIIKKDEN